ncbi:MAG: hypothetical protein ABH950_07700 [Candidatus Altiarchaeota archaeon]
MTFVSASQENKTCVIYFTGIGCPHCAKTDPIVLGKLPLEHMGDFVVIEYEIYQQQENAHVMYDYNTKVNADLGVPQTVFEEGDCVVGDNPIIEKIPQCIKKHQGVGARCQLLDQAVYFNELDVTKLPGSPNIWVGDRILIKKGDSTIDSRVLLDIFLADDIEGQIGKTEEARIIPAESVPLSGSEVSFSKAAELEGWIIQWGRTMENTSQTENSKSTPGSGSGMPMNPIMLLIVAFGFVLGLGIVKKLRGGTK